MIIGVDCDGVLVDIGSYQLKYSEPYFKKNTIKILLILINLIQNRYMTVHIKKEKYFGKSTYGDTA